MGLKNSHTTADFLQWDTAMSLIRKLFRDGDYRMSLFIGCGCFTGLRVSDLRRLRWSMLMEDKFIIIEQKTGKRREIKINPDFQGHIRKCYKALNIQDMEEHCFLSQKKGVYSTQRLNVKLKNIKTKYNLKIDNFSCHSLRKTFGRRIFEQSGSNAEIALVKLSELFNHSNVAITRIYLGIRRDEILHCYDMLDF